MDEHQLANYALITFLLGLLVLGYVVLFVPVSFSTSTDNFVDGIVTATYPTENGVVIIAKDVGESSYFLDEQKNISVGDYYRFYNPSTTNPKSDLQSITFLRKLSKS